MKIHNVVVLATTLSSLALSLAVQGQCVPALRGFSSGPIDMGIGSSQRSYITTLMQYDDGSGPALFAAGQFNLSPSPSLYTHVAKYQNGLWTPMPMPQESQVNVQVVDLAVQDFSLIGGPVRSMYALASNGRVYRWTGSEWSMVGTRQTSIPYGLLATSDDAGPVLLMCRTGSPDDGVPRVLAWRGSGDWTPYGTAINGGYVTRLRTVDDGSGPATFALGGFRDSTRGIKNIAKFVDGEWAAVPFPDTADYAISDITTYDDGTHGPELYLSAMQDSDSGPALNLVARVYRLRDGAWAPVEVGDLTNWGYAPDPAFVKLDEGDGEKLHLAGYLKSSQQSGLFRMTPSGWQPLFYLRGPDQSTPGAVFAAARFDDGGGLRTFIGGDFMSTSSSFTAWTSANTRAYSMLQSNPEAPLGYGPTALGLGELVNGTSTQRYCLSPVALPEGPRLLMTGGFTRAGGQRVLGAASFDGQTFAALDVTASSTALQDAIYVPIDGVPRLLAAAPASNIGPIAFWTGSQWQRFFPMPASSFNINKLVSLNGEPVVLMTTHMSVYRNGSWQVMANLTESYTGVVGDLGQGVRFYFGGTGDAGTGVYQFDGQTVTFLGPTVGVAAAMTIHDDGNGAQLYIFGNGFGGLSRFNGSAFEPVPGSTIVMGGGNLSFASYDDGLGPALYALGGFARAGGQDVNGFARWRNNQWEPVVPYVAPVPSWYRMGRTSMAVFNDRLYLAGDFTSIGTVNADRLAVIEPCRVICSADYNYDGDAGTDLDIEAFFACLAGNCCTRCTADFNNDGDTGTDADIESFFRVLAGGPC